MARELDDPTTVNKLRAGMADLLRELRPPALSTRHPELFIVGPKGEVTTSDGRVIVPGKKEQPK